MRFWSYCNILTLIGFCSFSYFHILILPTNLVVFTSSLLFPSLSPSPLLFSTSPFFHFSASCAQLTVFPLLVSSYLFARILYIFFLFSSSLLLVLGGPSKCTSMTVELCVHVVLEPPWKHTGGTAA